MFAATHTNVTVYRSGRPEATTHGRWQNHSDSILLSLPLIIMCHLTFALTFISRAAGMEYKFYLTSPFNFLAHQNPDRCLFCAPFFSATLLDSTRKKKCGCVSFCQSIIGRNRTFLFFSRQQERVILWKTRSSKKVASVNVA